MSGRIISRAESWETAYQAFQNINFTAFDYQSIKQSMIEYIKLYFPETFNDFIESSEFIALLELFAYLGELTAYRIDMASHENFLPTAQRKQSILRLAKLISYNASRNIPARGLVKISSISTSEPVYDSRGNNLANVKIVWNDPSNINWKDQFLLVMDKVLKQTFGSVSPSDRVQVQDVLFELYALNNVPFPRGVVAFSADVAGDTYPMELVPSSLNNDGPYEKRPEVDAPMTILYGSDGLGDGSIGTGFFFFCKQGELQLITNSFDGITPNQTFTIGSTNINETDVWVNNVDPDTLEILTGNEEYIRNTRAGEWVQVDLAHAQNIIYNTNTIRNKYEIETLEDDDVRVIFGDGEFATIPNGLFHFWFRTSANEDLVIPQSSVSNIESSFTYVDVSGITRTFTFSFSATNTFQNAAQSEDIEHIRRMAPSVYYTQDRMVNGRDYNTFMLQDQTILKIRSFNRTFAGESNYVNYVTFNDPSGAYDNVKIFGDDLALYTYNETLRLPNISPSLVSSVVIRNYVEPLLSNPNLFLYRAKSGDGAGSQTRTFTNDEYNSLLGNDVNITTGIDYSSETAYLWWNNTTLEWTVETVPNASLTLPIHSEWAISITKGADVDPWIINYKSVKVVAESPETKFWFHNEDRVINYDSLNPGNDLIVVLSANGNKNRNGVLTSNKNLIVLDSVYVTSDTGPLADIGLPNIHQFSTIYEDADEDLLPDLPVNTNYIPLSDLIDPVLSGTIIDVEPHEITVKNSTDQYISIDGNHTSVFVPGSQITLNGGTTIFNVTGNFYNSITGRTRLFLAEGISSFMVGDEINLVFAVNLPFPAIEYELTVIDTNISGNEVTVASDFSSVFIPGKKFSVNQSADVWTVVGSTFDTTNTIITVQEDISTYGSGIAIGNTLNVGDVNFSLMSTNGISTVGVVYDYAYSNIATSVKFINATNLTKYVINMQEYVYFSRPIGGNDYWEILPTTVDSIFQYLYDTTLEYDRRNGRYPFNFMWMHRTPNHHLVDPAAMNIIDTYIVTRGYYISLRRWLDGYLPTKPSEPTPLDLKTSYSYMTDNKMISDSLVLHPGKFRILFGSRASAELQAKFKIIRSNTSLLTDNQIKIEVITAINNFFDINKWEFGETFYFTELAAVIHAALPVDIDSVVLVPLYSTNHFGDLFQVHSKEDELFISDVTVDDIEIIGSISRTAIKQCN